MKFLSGHENFVVLKRRERRRALKNLATRYDDFKKSKMLSNWPKWLVVTQSILLGNEDLEIFSYVSSFSAHYRFSN